MRQLKISKRITQRNNSSIDKYLTEISRESLLSAENEVELSLRIKQGDQDAMDTLIRSNLRFVVSVAKQYQNQGLGLEDLINEGNIGMIKAAKKFDETKGFKFISYAVWWIRQQIMQAISEQTRMVRLPLNKINDLNKCYKEISRFEQQHERTPLPEEIASSTDISVKKINTLLKVSSKPVSLDVPVSEENDTKYSDRISDSNYSTDHILVKESMKDDMMRALKLLSDKEQFILTRYYGLGCPEMCQTEIGVQLDLSTERVRQLKDRSLKKLRRSSHSRLLMQYLG